MALMNPGTSAPRCAPSLEAFADRRESICVVGLGYVGLPLAVAFAARFRVLGFDIDPVRVQELQSGHDRTLELTEEQLRRHPIEFTTDPAAISRSRLVVVTVPTPIDAHHRPDLTPLIKASKLIGRHIEAGTTVVFESTVYPGCTEEDCIPVIEHESGLTWRREFYAGYSPERINPGDREHTVEKIRKVVAGDLPATANLLAGIYGAVITAGIHVAPTLKTAEAAKVIENTQRDLNIALMNELALIFDRQGIDTLDVLEAAGTKWNFLPFRPGLVGGHCIGVDPYYLAFKAESLGYHPDVILAGRRVNDSMGKFIAEKTVKLLIQAGRAVKGAKVLILGWTFKENVPDVRNTRVIDILTELRSYGVRCLPVDPHADPEEVRHEYGVELAASAGAEAPYDAIVLAVKHRRLVEAHPLEVLRQLGGAEVPVLIDVKGFFDPVHVAEAGWGTDRYWRL
jgi:UDP-N-acetyl-D-galactosamine dehydrogenase